MKNPTLHTATNRLRWTRRSVGTTSGGTMHRMMAGTVLVLSLSIAGVNDLLAQRSGFIIGLGVGVGVTAANDEGQTGLATDFKIGAQASQSIQIYYLGRTNWFGDGQNTVAAGISALGVTYVLPSAPVHLSGGVGLASWLPLCFECSGGGFGFGVTGGVGYEFADLWLLDFALTYGRPDDRGNPLPMFMASVGISILSH